ncbi:hypothetical protein G7Y89_g1390 [Cudoniella acicularis]|uniref:Spindle pole body-associated protein cut12 domain-containing protein n=1 Tax=Cudoniella acicularis TaxID=354080 RepID=A0A8H4RX61_9HELO|nr:hypothetical protein G7Y89_g1390 [Cudoniella acicularis]
MLNWWLGRGVEGSRELGDHQEAEPPETPAPVFAARALKSAIFGTPARPVDDTLCEIENPVEVIIGKDVKAPQTRSSSPTKPPGILLTPGTGTTRRKTVSFGKELVDKVEDLEGEIIPRSKREFESNDCIDEPTKKGSTRRDTSSRHLRRTSLINRLERVKEEKVSSSESSRAVRDQNDGIDTNSKEDQISHEELQSNAKTETKASKTNSDLLQNLATRYNGDGDATMDLDHPHSRSGQYWKSQWQTYHDQAQAEMQRLLKYKNHAKTYAKKKDATAIELAEKLKEAQRKVLIMENMVSELSARVAAVGLEDADGESPELMQELARQTALALEYKAQVEEFREALEGGEAVISASQEQKNPISPRSEKTLIDTHHELKKAREQLREMAALREELKARTCCTLIFASGSKKKILRGAGNCQMSSAKKKDEALKNLQQDYEKLKDIAKSQRRDAEQLLQKKHDQAVEYRREIKSLRAAQSNVQQLEQALNQKTVGHEKVVGLLQDEITALKTKLRPEITGAELGKIEQTSERVPSIEAGQSRESHIPISVQSISRPSKTLPSSRRKHSETTAESPMPRSSQALSEIVNNASFDTVPPKTSGPVHYTPLSKRFSDMSLNPPKLDLPSSESSLPLVPRGRAIPERDNQQSPRPSMFNIASSPPKPAIMRSRASMELPRQKVGNETHDRRHKSIASSRLSSMDTSRARNTIPPERAAAARARLKQKNAEKKRVQALGAEKENIPN